MSTARRGVLLRWVVLPQSAALWEISEDGLVYVFHLVADARFHDGTRFDSSHAYTRELIKATPVLPADDVP